MALTVIADVELLAVNYLRAHPDIAAVVGARVYTALPPTPGWPLIRLERIGGTVNYVGWLDTARLQVEGWAETDKAAALDVTSRALAALLELTGVRPEGVVAGVRQDGPLVWLPDPDTTRPRYLFGCAVYTHPL